jgi:two-component system, cell cycle response regulator DivK
VIVMDLAMPGLNGITATHRLKQHPRTRRIPVIVLTGYAFRAIEQGALEAGADVFLTKPCLPEELELTIRSLFG